MAQSLMGLQDLLSQSSNASSDGLLGGGVFSQPESRGQRRSRLLTEAISDAGQNPYARLGASFGGLIGMGGRAAAEGLGIVDAPAEVQEAEAIKQVQQEVAEQGLDPMANPREFGQYVSSRFQELNQPQLATRSLLQARQLESAFAPESIEPATFFNQETNEYVRGGYRNGVAVNERGQPLGQGFVERDFEAPRQEEIDRSTVDRTLPTLLNSYNEVLSSDLDLNEQDSALSQIDVQLSRLPSTPRTKELRERVSSRLQSLRSQEKSVIVTPGTAEFDAVQEQLSEFGNSLPTDQGSIEVKFDEAGRPSNFETGSGAVQVNTPSPASEAIIKETSKARDRLSEKRDLLLESARIASDIYSDSSSANLGPVGFVSRIGDGIIQQARAAASEFDLNIDPSNYNFGDFKDSAIESVETKSAITAYAFSIAKADNKGRVTDQDVQRAIDQIAGSSGSISQVKAGIATRLGNSIKGFDDVVLARQSDFEEIQGLSAPTSVSQFMRNNPERYNPELLQNLGVLNSSNAQGTDQAGANNQDTVLRYNPETETVE